MSNDNNNKSPLLPLPPIKKYKAYHAGRFFSSRQVYEEVDLFELHTVRYPLYSQNYLYYQECRNETPVIVAAGSEKRITQMLEPKYYSSSFSSSLSSSSSEPRTESYPPYMIVLARLYKRRFFNILKIELEQWAIESREEENTIFIGQPIAGIAVCREILQASEEERFMHPVVAASDPELHGKDDFERHNYTITYEPIGCDRLDCSKCYAPIEILNESQLFTLGKSRYDPGVVATNKKRAKRRKLLKLRRILQASIMLTTTLDATMDPDEYYID